jgi:hypothetical protein
MIALFRTGMLLVGLTIVAGLSIGVPSAWAGSLAGDTINGSMNFCGINPADENHFTPGSGNAPIAFVYDEGPGGATTNTATFSATGLTVEANVSSFACGFGMTFADVTTPFPKLALVSSNFGPSLTFKLDGDSIEVSWTGTDDWLDSAFNPGDFVAVFNIVGELPEPRSLAVFGVGLTGAGLIRQRRRSSGLAESVR